MTDEQSCPKHSKYTFSIKFKPSIFDFPKTSSYPLISYHICIAWLKHTKQGLIRIHELLFKSNAKGVRYVYNFKKIHFYLKKNGSTLSDILSKQNYIIVKSLLDGETQTISFKLSAQCPF